MRTVSNEIFFNRTGIFRVLGHTRRHNDCNFGEQTWQTVPHAVDVVGLFDLLHTDRSDRYLLDGFETVYLVAGVDPLSHHYIHVFVRDHADRMGTAHRNIPYEVSESLLVICVFLFLREATTRDNKSDWY